MFKKIILIVNVVALAVMAFLHTPLAHASVYFPAAQPSPSVTVSIVGTGAGTVTSSPAGISCPGTCSHQFNIGASITLTATPAASNASSTVHGTGTEMYAWGGTACNGQSAAGNCTFTFNASSTATATFTPKDSDVWWVSPTGSDSNNGRSITTPFGTIHKFNTVAAAGDTLYFANGTFTDSLGGFNGQFAKDVVDGNASKSTRFYGYNPHSAIVDGSYLRRPLYLWHNNYVEVAYLNFMHSSDQPCSIDGSSNANPNFNATYIWIHDSGCAYSKPGTSGANLIGLAENHCDHCTFERNWVWGYGSRYAIMLYSGTNNVARENVVRYDGAPDGQPKAGLTVYDEDFSIAENNISLDFDQGTDSTGDVHASLFTTSSVTVTNYPYGLGTVAWYGNIAMNTGQAGNGGMYFDSHASIASGSTGTIPSTLIVRDNIVAQINGGTQNTAGMWFSADTAASTQPGNHAVTIDHNTVYGANSASQLRLDSASWTSFALTNDLIHGGTFTSSGCYRKLWSGVPTASNNLWFNCNNTLYTTFPSSVNSNPAFQWLENVTSGPAYHTGSDGLNIGATIINKYQNGTLTGAALWPFPNESYIQADLCAGPDSNTASVCTNGATPCAIYTRGHNATGFCASGVSLTKYIWQQLGNTSPY